MPNKQVTVTDLGSNVRRRYKVSLPFDLFLPALSHIESYDLFVRLDPSGDCMNCLRVRNGRAIVGEGHAFDGCSNPFSPSGDFGLPTFTPCVMHDVLRLAADLDTECPWSRLDSDLIFLDLMAIYMRAAIRDSIDILTISDVFKKWGLEVGAFLWRWVYFLAVIFPIGNIFDLLQGLRGLRTESLCKSREESR